MNEKTLIQRTINHLILRDILIIFLICIHIFSYYKLFNLIRTAMLPVIAGLAILWIIIYIRLIVTACKARKDNYLKEAFKDEFFSGIKLKAGFNAYATMAAVSLIFLLIGIIFELTSAVINMPVYIICELIISSGIIADDISKIILAKS